MARSGLRRAPLRVPRPEELPTFTPGPISVERAPTRVDGATTEKLAQRTIEENEQR